MIENVSRHAVSQIYTGQRNPVRAGQVSDIGDQMSEIRYLISETVAPRKLLV